MAEGCSLEVASLYIGKDKQMREYCVCLQNKEGKVM